jgi:hypothetical protein
MQATVKSEPLTESKTRLVDYDDDAKSSKNLEIKNIEYDFVSLDKLKELGIEF